MTILRTSNKTWTYDFWHFGKRLRKRFKSKEQAIKAEAQKRLEFNANSFKNEQITFRQASQLFFEKHSKPNKRSWKSDLSEIEYLNTLFGDKKLVDFTALDIQNMRNELKQKGLKSSSIDRNHALVKAIFNKMIFWDRFRGFNPANGVKLKREPNAHIRYLSQEEVRLLEENLKGDIIYPYYLCALHTGMRRSEICNLKWKDVSLPVRNIFIKRSKSGKERHVPINNTLHDYLIGVYSKGINEEDHVFGKLSPDYISHRFEKFCNRLGIKHFTFHLLRHTFASYLTMAGVSIYQVCKWLGHSSVKVTENYYAHLSPNFKKEEIEHLNKLSKFDDFDRGQTNFGQTFEKAEIKGSF
ncbi:MAG: site-specific integrase [Endomicrobiales bacterium]|nr:site-specific integrase [Endomicrobiales bacterium]